MDGHHNQSIRIAGGGLLVILLLFIMHRSGMGDNYSEAKREVRLIDGANAVRQAYLLTVDPDAKRTVYTANVLKTIGFRVNYVQPDALGDDLLSKVWSNKNTFLKAYTMHLDSGDTEFGYFFEDDADVFPQYAPVTMQEVIEQEMFSPWIFSYLGVISWEKKSHRKSHMCGRGAHAFGLSPLGLRMLVEFNAKEICKSENDGVKKKGLWYSIWGQKNVWQCAKEPYMDIVLENFCTKYGKYGGFPVLRRHQGVRLFDVGNYTGIGALMQNRGKFATSIAVQPQQK